MTAVTLATRRRISWCYPRFPRELLSESFTGLNASFNPDAPPPARRTNANQRKIGRLIHSFRLETCLNSSYSDWSHSSSTGRYHLHAAQNSCIRLPAFMNVPVFSNEEAAGRKDACLEYRAKL